MNEKLKEMNASTTNESKASEEFLHKDEQHKVDDNQNVRRYFKFFHE